MSGAQYLERRASGIYFVRLYVPARLKTAVGKGEIHRTTGCRDYRLAKIVAAELAAHWQGTTLAVSHGHFFLPVQGLTRTAGPTPQVLL